MYHGQVRIQILFYIFYPFEHTLPTILPFSLLRAPNKIRGRNPSTRRGYAPVHTRQHREDHPRPILKVPIPRIVTKVGGNRDLFRLADILLHRFTYRSFTKFIILFSFFFFSRCIPHVTEILFHIPAIHPLSGSFPHQVYAFQKKVNYKG